MATKKKKKSIKKKLSRPIKRKLFIGLLFAFVIFTILLCIFFYKQQQNTITLGLNLELSGEFAAVGESSKNGAELAVQQINNNGGVTINGKNHTIALLTKDNESDANTAAVITEELIKQNVVGIIGPNASKFAIAAAEVAEKNQIVLISPWSTNPQTTQQQDGIAKKYIFRTAYLDPFQGRALARFASQELKAQKAAVLYDETVPVLEGQAQYFVTVFEESGGSIALQLNIDPSHTNYQELARTLADYDADVIFLPVYYKDAASLIQAARKQGITAPILGSDAWESTKLLSRCGKACDGSFLSAHFTENDPRPEVTAFVSAYQKKYGETPDDVAALSYDSVALMVQAMEKCQCAVPEDIVKGMRMIHDYEGVTGMMTFPPDANDPIKSVVLLEITDGKLNFKEQIKPY